MTTWKRAATALALVAAVTTVGGSGGAGAQPEGDTFAANVSIDIRVIGNPPPGTQVVLEAPNVDGGTYPFDLDAADEGTNDVFVVAFQSTAPVVVTTDGGADAIRPACLSTSGTATCRVLPPGDFQGTGIEYVFPGGEASGINAAFTFVFGTCDGRPITGETPTNGPDVLLGTSNGETVNGGAGNDVLCGAGGVDTLRGGDGRDRLLGGGAADRLEGGPLGDVLFGGVGTDTLLGLAGNDALDGGAERDVCSGGTEQDTAVRCEVRNGIP